MVTLHARNFGRDNLIILDILSQVIPTSLNGLVLFFIKDKPYSEEEKSDFTITPYPPKPYNVF